MTAPIGPAYLTPTYRYAGDDWAGANALTYTVYSVAPVYASDGVTITTPGTPMDLTGFTVSGQIYYRPERIVSENGRFGRQPMGPALTGVVGAIVNAKAGTISLSVQKANTAIVRQGMADWYCDVPSGQTLSTGAHSKLIAQPMVTDPSNNLVTVGLQPLYVV